MTKVLLLFIAGLLSFVLIFGVACSGTNIEITLAPIHEVNITLMKSYPPQVDVYIKGGLPDGCTTFNDATVTREGTIVNIKVTVQRPRDAMCPAIYGFFEKNINLGSNFVAGITYTVNVNDHTTTFTY